MDDLYTLVASVIESWATYDNCPCGNARREHAKFMLDFLGKEKTPDITEPLKNLKATKSGAIYEDQVVTVLGVLNRVSKIVNESIFDIKRELAESRRRE